MSLILRVLETVAKVLPDRASDPLLRTPGAVGKPLNRVDGPSKVTGRATFTAEFQFPHTAFAALVYSTIAKGNITMIDVGPAQNAPGVLAIVTHKNAPKMKVPPQYPSSSLSSGAAASSLPVMQSDQIYWNGQPIAVVVAETQDQAEYAASLVQVDYQPEQAAITFDELKATAKAPPNVLGQPTEVNIGDAEAGLRESVFKVDQVFRTPRYNHNAIELHATTAMWNDDGELTVYDSTQSIAWFKHTIAAVFDLKPEKVRVLAPFVGGAFGGKVMLWNHTLLCVAAAKIVGRPVKLVLSRAGVFRTVGGRTLSEQRVALGAAADGKLRSLIHSGITAMVSHNSFPEQFSFPARSMYASERFFIGQKTVDLDMVANTAMRAPGVAIGMFELESAIDELAHALKMDPIELRRINEPTKDPVKRTPFSSRHLLEAYQRGAERFGWANRSPEPRSQRDGTWLIGQGVASAYYPYVRLPGAARVCIFADGTALVQAAGHEMGMGTATVQIQHAADRLGLPVERVSFEYGDSNLPITATAGGSAQTASIVAAVAAAVEKLHKKLLKLVADDSALAGAKGNEIKARDGGLFRTDKQGQGETYVAILQHAGKDHIAAEANAPLPLEIFKYSMHSYGAQFCEVRVNDTTGEVRVSRWVGSFDCGKILNPQTAQSQFRGGIVMGIGMALTEDTLFDERYGRIANPSLAEYHVPVHLDIPHIDILYTDIPDEHAPLGLHGVGEIGITGAAAAIANAIFNATGIRIRELPITLDKLLSGTRT